MTERASESHDSLNDESWFDRPAPQRGRGGITREQVFAALKDAGLETDAAPDAPVWGGLDDSWFDRPAGTRK